MEQKPLEWNFPRLTNNSFMPYHFHFSKDLITRNIFEHKSDHYSKGGSFQLSRTVFTFCRTKEESC